MFAFDLPSFCIHHFAYSAFLRMLRRHYAGRCRVAAGRLGASGGWRLAARLALEWLRVGRQNEFEVFIVAVMRHTLRMRCRTGLTTNEDCSLLIGAELFNYTGRG